jgi:glycosyltransferase involved in cell wall biosynthesis
MGLPQNYFLYVGRFVEKKNLRRLLDAFSLYRKRAGSGGWSIVLVGDGPEKEALEARSREADLAGSIVTRPFAQYAELPAYYGLAAAFVLPSLADQWGLVVNEAMASGLPVLVSKRCGCAEDLVTDGETGFTFDPADTAMMAERLALMAHGTIDRAKMAAAACERIAHWSLDRFVAGFLAASDHAVSVAGDRRSTGGSRPARGFDALLLEAIARLSFRPAA